MNYYRHNKTKEVFSYSAESIDKTKRLTELESLIQDNEPAFIDAENKLKQALLVFNQAKEQLDVAIENKESEEAIKCIQKDLTVNEMAYNEALILFHDTELKYSPYKDEYDSALPVFFEIRKNLKDMKKMTAKEIEAHLNPPVLKEQYIAEAESKKQMLLYEATETIAPLQDAVDLDMATDEEASLLKEWKKYRVFLNRIDTSLAPDIEWPKKPF